MWFYIDNNADFCENLMRLKFIEFFILVSLFLYTFNCYFYKPTRLGRRLISVFVTQFESDTATVYTEQTKSVGHKQRN